MTATEDGKRWAKAMTDAVLIDQFRISFTFTRMDVERSELVRNQAQDEMDALTYETERRGICFVCLFGFVEGDQQVDEIRTGEDCKVCDKPACETHGRTYDRKTLSGWAHELCGEEV